MCRFRSAVAILNVSDQTVSLKMLPKEDSRQKIRTKFRIRDDGTPAASRQTSLEYVPQKTLSNFASYKLVFDAGQPDWWTQEHTESAVRQFQDDIRRILADPNGLHWYGNLYLRSLTTLPKDAKITAGNVYFKQTWHGPMGRKKSR